MKRILPLIISVFFIVPAFAQELYKSSVTASYYAEDFHGKKTSNGEIFNMNALTCAHKSLPFNTELKVTNLANGKSVVVRVNDRGPFVPYREIDLSKAAAVQLGMTGSGTTSVKLEIIKKGPSTKISQQTAASAEKLMVQRFGKDWDKSISTDVTKGTESKPVIKPKPYPAGTRWDIQIGAFSSRANAENRAKELSKAGFKNIVYQKTKDITRVAIKDIPADKVSEIEAELREKGFTEYTVRQRKK